MKEAPIAWSVRASHDGSYSSPDLCESRAIEHAQALARISFGEIHCGATCAN